MLIGWGCRYHRIKEIMNFLIINLHVRHFNLGLKIRNFLILLLKSLLMHKRIAIYLKLYNEYLMDYILKGIKENKLIVNIINLPDKPCYFYPVLFFQTRHYKDEVWSQLQHYRGYPSWYNSFRILSFINNSVRKNSRLIYLKKYYSFYAHTLPF